MNVSDIYTILISGLGRTVYLFYPHWIWTFWDAIVNGQHHLDIVITIIIVLINTEEILSLETLHKKVT